MGYEETSVPLATCFLQHSIWNMWR